MTQITLGKSGSRNVSVELEILLRTRLLIQANSGGGKSWLLRRLAEQLFGKVQIIIIDPEGEFATLREKFGFVLVGDGGETAADPRTAALLAVRLLELGASAICDLYEAFRTRPSDRRLWVRRFLEAIVDAPKKLWHPVIVVVDEAHKFCPQETPKGGSQAEKEAIIGCKEAMISLATTGRKRGFCAAWATQRLAKLDKDASSELHNRLVGLTFEDVDVDRAMDLLSVSRDDRPEFKKEIRVLEPGSFFGIGRAISMERIRMKSGDVQTTHPEPGSVDYTAEPPPTPEKIKALLPKLADLPKEVETKAKTEEQLRVEVRSLKAQLAARPKEDAPKLIQSIPVKVEIPVITPKDLVAFESVCGKLTIAAKAIEMSAGNIRGHVDAMSNRIGWWDHQKKVAQEKPALSSGGLVYRDALISAQRKLPPSAPPASVAEGNGELTAGEKKLLQTLAQRHPLKMTRGVLATLSGYTSRGGSFQAHFGGVKRKKYIEQVDGDSFLITVAGLDVLGGDLPAAPRTRRDVLDRWNAVLCAGERLMLDELVRAFPEKISREKLGELVGYTASGGTFQAYIGTLRRNGLATLVDGELLFNSAEIFAGVQA